MIKIASMPRFSIETKIIGQRVVKREVPRLPILSSRFFSNEDPSTWSSSLVHYLSHVHDDRHGLTFLRTFGRGTIRVLLFGVVSRFTGMALQRAIVRIDAACVLFSRPQTYRSRGTP